MKYYAPYVTFRIRQETYLATAISLATSHYEEAFPAKEEGRHIVSILSLNRSRLFNPIEATRTFSFFLFGIDFARPCMSISLSTSSLTPLELKEVCLRE